MGLKWFYTGRGFANLDDRDVLLRFQVGDVVLELDDHFDQAHDRVVDFVIGAVQLSRWRRLKRRFLVFFLTITILLSLPRDLQHEANFTLSNGSFVIGKSILK